MANFIFMKKVYLFLVLFAVQSNLYAQRINAADYKILQQKEDSLKGYAQKIIRGINSADRFNADSIFTKVFVRALKTSNAFYYPFDSLFTISKLYAPDSSFRIFTWQMVINDNVIRQHGAIQMKTADGSLQLFPLIDRSDVTTDMSDTIANHLGWMGAVYYKIILKQSGNKKIYTLLGFDQNNIRSDKKIIEVLQFQNGRPQFGNRIFSVPAGNNYKGNMARFIMEFKKDAGPRLTYDAEMDLIVFEHLVSESNQPNKKWTLVGDGDYEAFKWMDGRWVYIKKLFTQVTPQGQAPTPNPIGNSEKIPIEN